MTTITREAPNGELTDFDTTWSEEEIQKYLQLPEYQLKLKLPKDLKKE